MVSAPGIIKAASGLFRMGAGEDMDPRRAKRIILSNQISISIALLSLPYVLIYLLNGAGILGWMEIPIFLGYASVHRFNKAGFTGFSRLGLVTLANLDILVYTLSMGRPMGQHLFYLAAGIAPLILFDARERKSIIYGITLSSLLLLLTEAFAPEVGWFEPILGSNLHRVRVVQMATLSLVELLMLAYFFIGNRRAEIALAEASEAAKAADAAKSRFLDKMSGEIRAPLNEILSLAHLLLKSGLGQERRETLEDIQLSAQDLMTIVDEILDLSRIESGRMRLESAPFSPLRLGHAVLRPFEFEAGRKGLDLVLDADEALPPHLLGDAARLKQVLRNLLGNAFKFTAAGKVVLRIRTADADSGAYGTVPGSGPTRNRVPVHMLAFEIEDTGIGVPESARARIFEPFSQADSSTTRKYGGTGPGLFISKQIVEMMGGSMGLRAGPGGGAIFHFTVPLPTAVESAAMAGSHTPVTPSPEMGSLAPAVTSASSNPMTVSGPRPHAPAQEGGLPASAKALRILIVDDHALNRKVLDSILMTYDLRSDLAASAEEALHACERSQYHIIFMDCHMPGMDGYECTRRLRHGPRTGPRPTIIGVTADAMDNNLKRCLDAGMDGLLVKPIIERQLRGLIVECAGRMPL